MNKIEKCLYICSYSELKIKSSKDILPEEGKMAPVRLTIVVERLRSFEGGI